LYFFASILDSIGIQDFDARKNGLNNKVSNTTNNYSPWALFMAQTKRYVGTNIICAKKMTVSNVL